MQLGDKLRTLRKEENLSQEALAEKLQVSRQSVSKWESDQSTPEIQKILLICDLFKISTDEFLRADHRFSEETRKSSETQSLKDWIKKYQREILIIFAFILITSLIINIKGWQTLQDYRGQSERVRDQLYTSYFEDLDSYHDKLISIRKQEILTDASDLSLLSQRIFEMAQNHWMIDIDNEAPEVSGIIYYTALSVQWVTEALEDTENLTSEKLERIDEIPDLLDKILRMGSALQETRETYAEDIEDTAVYQEMYSIVIEMAKLTFAYGIEEDQLYL